MVPISLGPNFPQLTFGVFGGKDVSSNDDLAEVTWEDPEVLDVDGEVVMDPDLHIADFSSKLPSGSISHHVVTLKGFHKQTQIFSSLLSNATKITTSISHSPNNVIIKSY